MTDKPSAFEKRVKRQVTARDHRFFVVVSPGLEDICLKELELLFKGNMSLKPMAGGIEFEGTVTDGYAANLHLRTASRIIMRIDQVKATDFTALEKKILSIPWELYLYKNAPFSVQVTVKKSRLYHSGAVAERVEEVIRRRLDSEGETSSEASFSQTVYVRGDHDRFTLSLDCSGDLLYMRGIKTTGGKAPLRETLAAGMLLMAGYDGKMPLADPMCGSGSFSLEAALIAQKIPPGWHRNFAFFSWPCFRKGAWKELRREAEEKMVPVDSPLIFSSDLDLETIQMMKEKVASAGFSSLIEVSQEDFFNKKPPDSNLGKGLIMFNPPYGLRLGTQAESKRRIQRMFKVLRSNYPGWHMGLISPFDMKALSAGFPLSGQGLFHGGMRLLFVRGRVP